MWIFKNVVGIVFGIMLEEVGNVELDNEEAFTKYKCKFS